VKKLYIYQIIFNKIIPQIQIKKSFVYLSKLKIKVMKKYSQLLNNPPQLSIRGNAKEVIFTTISVMCDNIGYLRFKKNSEGEFKIDGMGYAVSNWQMESPIHEIEWKADEENWNEVIKMINTGTSRIESVISR
jgi:hypothetical protein